MLNLRRIGQLRRALDPVPEIEGFDEDTGLAGRELLLARVERQWDGCVEHHQPICLLLVNVDHFAVLRSTAGDEAAGKALARVAQVIADACRRRADFAGRVRQDEFAVLLTDTQAEGALRVAEQIRARVAGSPGDVGGRPPLTVSVGVASTVPTPARFMMSLIHGADQALKQAKADGRNRVVLNAGG